MSLNTSLDVLSVAYKIVKKMMDLSQSVVHWSTIEAYTHTHIHTHTYTHTHTHIHAHTHIYTHTHTRIHTHRQ